MPSGYFNQFWLIINKYSAVANQLQHNLYWNLIIFIKENVFQNVVCKILVMLLWFQYVNDQSLGCTRVTCSLYSNSILRDHFVYAPSQWETTLHCNIGSYWLDAYTWSLILHDIWFWVLMFIWIYILFFLKRTWQFDVCREVPTKLWGVFGELKLWFKFCFIAVFMDHFVYAPSQWEMTLHCDAISHWLGAYTKGSLSTLGDIMLYCTVL